MHANRSDQLYHNKTKLSVDLAHIRDWDEQAADLLETRPTEALPLVREIQTPISACRCRSSVIFYFAMQRHWR